VTRNGPVLGLGGTLAEDDIGGDMTLRFVPGPGSRLPQRRPVRRQVTSSRLSAPRPSMNSDW
jgi:hypothetical protein